MLTMNIIKKFRMFVVIFATAFSFLFAACVDDVPIDREFNETQKLVLYSRLCPQLDTTYILLTNSKLLYTNSNQSMLILKDGVVELSADGEHWAQATYLPEKERFFLTKEEFPIQEGATYYIRASYPGYENVSSSCKVPYSHDVGFRIDTVSSNGDSHLGEIYNWPHRDVYVEWCDVAGEENYYALMEKTLQIYNDEGNGEGPINASRYWTFYSVWLYLNNQEYRYVSDEGYDGSVMRYLVEDGLPEEGGNYGDDGSEKEYYFLFLDRNCYEYERTLHGSDFNMNFLLLEPEHTYTNIENGFGLFGAFCMRQVP